MTEPVDFKLERLKHVLKQQEFLNENSHKYLTVFQNTVAAIILAAVAVFMSYQTLSISVEIARASIRALEWLLAIAGVFVLLVVLTTIASWWDYRKEETDILNDGVRPGFRKPPSLSGIWRWFETWFLILVVCVICGTLLFAELAILPLIK